MGRGNFITGPSGGMEPDPQKYTGNNPWQEKYIRTFSDSFPKPSGRTERTLSVERLRIATTSKTIKFRRVREMLKLALILSRGREINQGPRIRALGPHNSRSFSGLAPARDREGCSMVR